MSTVKADICVLGAGPSGVAAAVRLVHLGYDVVLVSKPEKRQGRSETISPGVDHFLKTLGLGGVIDECRLPFESMSVQWDTPNAVEVSSASGIRLIDRVGFDQLSRDRASAAGVPILYTNEVGQPREMDGHWWVKVGEDEIRSRFLVFAGGKQSLTGAGRQRGLPALLCLSAQWPSTSPQIHMEALEDGWLWTSPTSDGCCTVATFCDPKLPNRSSNLDSCYHRLIDQSSLRCVRDRREQVTPIHACDASSLRDPDPVGENWIRIGENAFSFEPLSSQGIQVALKFGLQAAAVVHTMLAYSNDRFVAQQFYREQCETTFNRHVRSAREFYTMPERFQRGEFWQARAGKSSMRRNLPSVSAGCRFRLSPLVSIEVRPCLLEDRVALQCAISHPNLESPLICLGGLSLLPLLPEPAETLLEGELYTRWQPEVTASKSRAVFDWLVLHELLVPAD